jgi:hypothetical protein
MCGASDNVVSGVRSRCEILINHSMRCALIGIRLEYKRVAMKTLKITQNGVGRLTLHLSPSLELNAGALIVVKRWCLKKQTLYRPFPYKQASKVRSVAGTAHTNSCRINAWDRLQLVVGRCQVLEIIRPG